jgi:transcription elongation factor Elf1
VGEGLGYAEQERRKMMAPPFICQFCKKETDVRVKLLPYGKKGDMKCPNCGKIRKAKVSVGK